jgi:hypothetical protein
MKLKATNSGEQSLIVNVEGYIALKGMDQEKETSILLVNWLSAAKVAQECTQFHHGNDCGAALVLHHTFVQQIACEYSWLVAVEYDIWQCQMVSQFHTHDYSQYNVGLVTSIVVSPAMLLKAITTSNSSSKCSNDHASNSTGPAKKKQHGSYTCFWCGKQNHFPSNCTSSSTTVGHSVAPLATGTSNPNALQASNGKHFCFEFAKNSSCGWKSCDFHHGCSLCGNSDHGTAKCTA